MIVHLDAGTTQGSARTEGWAQKRPPLGGGAGAARRVGAPGGNTLRAAIARRGGSGAKRDASIPRNRSGVSAASACGLFEYFRQNEGAGR